MRPEPVEGPSTSSGHRLPHRCALSLSKGLRRAQATDSRGRLADLLSDETGQDSVLDVPMQSLLEFPGVPLTADDAQRLVTETA
jgi:hypothetical protein